MNEANTHPDYAGLPECIKRIYSEKEYCWLSDEEKRALVRDTCNPCVDEGES